MVIKRSVVFNHIFSLIILFPVIFSFIFSIIGLQIPSYLFILIISFLLLLFVSNGTLTISKSWFKVFFYIFFIWILSSIIYTPSVIASKEKFINILYNTVLPVIVIELFFLSSKRKSIDIENFEKNILKYAYILLWFSFFAYIVFRQHEDSGRYTLPGVINAIWFSRFIGMLFLIIICCTKINIVDIRIYVLSIVIALYLLFGGGSRGPVLAALITFLIQQSYLISKKRLLLLLIGVVIVIAIGFSFVGGYLFETNFYSFYARQSLYDSLAGFNFNYIKGVGIGSYALSMFGDDIIYYPHNVFLELFFENGLVGVTLFCLVLFLFFRSFKPNIVNFLCIYYLFSSLVSGDIPGNNNLFILLFISIYANKGSIIKKEDKKIRQPISLRNA